MFLKHLNRNQASALLGFARELMASDGVESPEEEELLEEFVREMDAYHVNYRMFTTREAKLQVFVEHRERLLALLALLQLAYVDGTFSLPEITFVQRLARDWSLDEETVSECEVWVLELMALRQRGRMLWNEEAGPLQLSREQATPGAADPTAQESDTMKADAQ